VNALKCRWLANNIGTVPGFFSPEECAAHIALGERLGYEEAPVTTDSGAVFMKDVRNNDRVMLDDAARAVELWQHIAPFVPPRLQKKWQPVGLNERLRFYRYDPGQQFGPN